MEFNYSTFMPAFLIWFIKSTGLSESNGNAFNLIKNRNLEWICKINCSTMGQSVNQI